MMTKNKALSFCTASMLLALCGCESIKTAMVGADNIDLVQKSYQYVALYNVINKSAMDESNAFRTGWNGTYAATELADHTMQAIARPNNDTLYVTSTIDMRNEPIVIHYPAFDSKFVCLETSAYDHYCGVPLSTTRGDFKKPVNILYYTARTKGYAGEPVKGVDKTIEMSGDFAMAFLRVMPHAEEPARLKKNLAAMQQVKAQTLSQYLGKKAPVAEPIEFPAFGSDPDVFENNYLEVMQFVFNHTTFDPADEMDLAILAALKPYGVEPGKTYDPETIQPVNGKKLSKIALSIQQKLMALLADAPEGGNPYMNDLFRPKGEMMPEPMLLQSVVGPIGLPSHQAVYPAIGATDRKPLNAQNNYVVRISKEDMPPARAFWSVTLYDADNGFFIPNDQKKYSVGENAGYQLADDGGIEIHIAAQQPEGVPVENWLPIERQDERLDLLMRIYDPDLEKMKTWPIPRAEQVK